MKHPLLRLLAAYLFSCYFLVFAISLVDWLRLDTKTEWISVAASPLYVPLMLTSAPFPKSHSLTAFEAARCLGVWAVFAGILFVAYCTASWKAVRHRRSVRVLLFPVVLVISVVLAFDLGMALQQRWMTEHDYYPHIASNGNGYVDRNGNMVIAGPFADRRVFHDGYAAVSVGGKYGFINLKGQMVIPPQFDEAYGFDEGFGRVVMNRKVGFIDRQGKMMIPPQYDEASGFSEGLAAVAQGGQAGYIDTSGRWIIAPRFKEAHGFSEGMAAATLDGEKWGYIDRSGVFIIEPRDWYPWSGEFHWGSARVRMGERLRRIDWRGEFID